MGNCRWSENFIHISALLFGFIFVNWPKKAKLAPKIIIFSVVVLNIILSLVTLQAKSFFRIHLHLRTDRCEYLGRVVGSFFGDLGTGAATETEEKFKSAADN